MKRKDLIISFIIIAACAGLLYLYSFTNSLVHGKIELISDDSTAVLRLRNGLFKRINISSNDEPLLVNARILRAQTLTISKHGSSFQLTSSGPWGDLSKIRIKNNQTTTIKVGPPFVIKPDVVKYPDQMEIKFSIIGQAGEQYQIPRLPKAPKVNIMDENGNTIASGNFSYG
ncbi:MAG: hypothetical protein JW787_00620 [Sedimentisphaerales bacterium]|nr:hypothetical protein [Sedimentisphaerales bacterium]